MSGRYTSSGQNRPHIVAEGYQHAPRVPGPILPMEEAGRPLVTWRRVLAFAAFVVVLALVANGDLIL